MTSHVLLAIFLLHSIILNLSCALSSNNGAPNTAKRWAQLSTGSSNRKQKPGTLASNKRRKGYELRNSRGVRKNRKRPPRWETEGDQLFFGSKADGSVPEVPGETPTELLSNLFNMKQQLQSEKKKPVNISSTSKKLS